MVAGRRGCRNGIGNQGMTEAITTPINLASNSPRRWRRLFRANRAEQTCLVFEQIVPQEKLETRRAANAVSFFCNQINQIDCPKCICLIA
jgi:hypothetical protein